MTALRVPVRFRDAEESHRRLAQAVNQSLSAMETLALVEAIAAEAAILRGSTTFAGNTLTNYPSSWTPPEPSLSDAQQLIAVDETLGTITVGYSGLYTLYGYVVQTGGTTDNQYVMSINASTAGAFPFGSGTWNNQTGGLVYYAETTVFLVAGEVLTLIAGANIPTISQSDLHVEMQSSENYQ